MAEEHLAIISMPMQHWGPIYEDEKALETGTIFHELYKPFFAAEKAEKPPKSCCEKAAGTEKEREQLLTRITETGFVLDDLALYLDTHKSDTEALQMFLEKTRKRDELKKEFAQKFYPLTRDCTLYCSSGKQFCWLEGPMPWEGACV